MNETRWLQEIDNEFWECENCKLAWVFNTGTPVENECNYCPKCGHMIVEFVFAEGWEE